MIDGFVGGLLLAWILTIFGVDNIIIGALQPFFTITLTVNHYYLLFAILGALSNIWN